MSSVDEVGQEGLQHRLEVTRETATKAHGKAYHLRRGGMVLAAVAEGADITFKEITQLLGQDGPEEARAVLAQIVHDVEAAAEFELGVGNAALRTIEFIETRLADDPAA